MLWHEVVHRTEALLVKPFSFQPFLQALKATRAWNDIQASLSRDRLLVDNLLQIPMYKLYLLFDRSHVHDPVTT